MPKTSLNTVVKNMQGLESLCGKSLPSIAAKRQSHKVGNKEQKKPALLTLARAF
ncbi:MAG: hypothetical protein K6L73_03490 [Cellvibrionaceae bacterium]